MAKIILDSEPSAFSNKCPFMKGESTCTFTNRECDCIGGYYDSISFDFERCNYCMSMKDFLRNL